MAVYQELPKHPELFMQPCPYCGQKQPVYIRGIWMSADAKGMLDQMVHPDMGYSFCNCKNIWYTNWSNIWQTTYNDEYADKHKVFTVDSVWAEYFNGMAPKLLPETDLTGKKFMDLGSVTSSLLDIVKTYGFDTTGVDIFEHKDFGHKQIIGDFEKIEFKDKYDIIWASHIFEHLYDPLKALKKCYDILNPDGRIFVAMPDVFFIDWDYVYGWMNWHVREHHIFFDMDIFAKEAEKIGFEVLMKRRNIDFKIHTTGDMQLIFRKP